MRKIVTYKISNRFSFKERLLHYAKYFRQCCVLDSNNWQEKFEGVHSNKNEMIAALGSVDEITPFRQGTDPRFCGTGNSFDCLKRFQEEKNDWLFGFLSYDLSAKMDGLSDQRYGVRIPSDRLSAEKNEIEAIHSLLSPLNKREKSEVQRGWPPMHFFQPKYVFCLSSEKTKSGKLEIHYLPEVSSEEEVKNIFEVIISLNPQPSTLNPQIEISPRISGQEYIQTITRIKNHIQRGDVYEMNYCMDFFSVRQDGRTPSSSGENAEINPAEVFLKLNEASQSPFSAFYRMNDNYLLCASPERFLKKSGRKIISQPIKGTVRRGETAAEDAELKEQLLQNEKDRSENVMIVDLVRNDLSRTCDNVVVEELFGIYTFRQWHQMISTVSGEMKEDIHFTDVIKNAFPMGSMTGAPKIRAMELIEQYEKTKRGLYSGAVGYISPEADFDFNVVIRSILYNATSNYLSFSVGSAITANSIPEKEYEECLLKAKGMFSALGKPELTINHSSLIGASI